MMVNVGNPHGGLVFSTVWNNGTNGLGEQIHEWTNFMSDQEYCIRVCKEGGAMATSYCQHVYGKKPLVVIEHL